ncbi:MAG TPA: acetyl-CoA acetyltransferase [Acidimicrobiales bacterium]|nr:acetyl-CoA acetyltransferase [Acidimicrobiales bacterium]
MVFDPRTPVVVGVGQLMRKPTVDDLDGIGDNIQMMAEAARRAAQDSGAGDPTKFLASVQSVRTVAVMSWRLKHPSGALAAAIDADPKQFQQSTVGGNSPQMLMTSAANDILSGKVDSVLIAGSEAFLTRRRASQAGVTLPWGSAESEAPMAEIVGHDRNGSNDVEMSVGLMMPTQVYPLFENGLRGQAPDGPLAHEVRVSEMWQRFNVVAQSNPYAWSPEPMTAEEIRTPSDDNRYIGYPYTKYQNANMTVDQAAAVLVCSVEAAQAAGIPEDKWVFPWSGSDCNDHWFVSERANLYSAPAVGFNARAALGLAGIGMDDVNHIEIYSCFPCMVQMSANAMGIDPFGDPRPLTQTGGLCFFGGPGNNYTTHGIASMVERLRAEPGIGLVTGNGWYSTKHSLGIYSTTPPATPFRSANPQPELNATPRTKLVDEYEGAGTLESFVVMHERDGSPAMGTLAVRVGDDARTWATTTDRDFMAWLESGEPVVGTAVTVKDRAISR